MVWRYLVIGPRNLSIFDENGLDLQVGVLSPYSQQNIPSLIIQQIRKAWLCVEVYPQGNSNRDVIGQPYILEKSVHKRVDHCIRTATPCDARRPDMLCLD